jgi:hypothetical protein
LKRDVTTGILSVILDAGTMGEQAPDTPFGPHGIAIDPATYDLFVTDVNNDDIWVLTCAETSITGLSCGVYAPLANKLELEDDGSGIETPSGIEFDLQGNLYVTGMQNGIVARYRGTTSIAMLPAGSLVSPVSLGYDSRATSKSIYISDDGINGGGNQALYELACLTFTCVALTDDFIPNVLPNQCVNTSVGETCNFKCAPGYFSTSSSVLCTEDGWDIFGIACVESDGSGGSDGSDGSDSSGGPGATTITSGQQQQVDDDDIDNDDMDPGIIALIVIASVLVLAGIVVAIVFATRQKTKTRRFVKAETRITSMEQV